MSLFRYQSTLQARITKLGHCDYLKCRNLANTKITDEGDASDAGVKIIMGLLEEIENLNLTLFLFTHDVNF